jgi:hypothetical protein
MAIILTTRHFGSLWNIDRAGAPPPMPERTLDSLKSNQRRHLAKNPAAHEPEIIVTPAEAYIGNGAWRIHCRCGERTHTDPTFGEACCFGCGAVYTDVVFPSDRAEIEELLAKRPVQAHRNWQPPETLETLRAEQIEHGDPV